MVVVVNREWFFGGIKEYVNTYKEPFKLLVDYKYWRLVEFRWDGVYINDVKVPYKLCDKEPRARIEVTI